MFRADVTSQPLTFDPAGLIRMNLVMRDRQTGSKWQQATGEAFEGRLKGKHLSLYPFLLTTWKEWQTRYPNTLALVPEPQFAAEYERMGRMSARLQLGGGPPLRGVLREDARLPAREMVMGIEAGGGYKAYPVARLKQAQVVNDQVGTEPVLVVYEARSDTTTAFSRRLAGRVLTFRPLESSPIQLSDKETSSVWTTYGECIRGTLKGQELEPLTPLPSFWFSWAEFFPKTELYTGSTN